MDFGTQMGLIQGVGEGIRSGIEQYQQGKNYQREFAKDQFRQKMQTLQQKGLLGIHGYEQDPDTGDVSLSSAGQQRLDMEAKSKKFQARNEILKNITRLQAAGLPATELQKELAQFADPYVSSSPSPESSDIDASSLPDEGEAGSGAVTGLIAGQTAGAVGGAPGEAASPATSAVPLSPKPRATGLLPVSGPPSFQGPSPATGASPPASTGLLPSQRPNLKMAMPSVTNGVGLTTAQRNHGLAIQKYNTGVDQRQAGTEVASLKELKSDPEYKGAVGGLAEAQKISSLIDSATTNPASANALPIYLARFSTNGQRLNKNEIEAFGGGSKAIGDRIQQIMNEAQSGTISGPNANYLKGFIQTVNAVNHDQAVEKEIEATTNFKHVYGYVPPALTPILNKMPEQIPDPKGGIFILNRDTGKYRKQAGGAPNGG